PSLGPSRPTGERAGLRPPWGRDGVRVRHRHGDVARGHGGDSDAMSPHQLSWPRNVGLIVWLAVKLTVFVLLGRTETARFVYARVWWRTHDPPPTVPAPARHPL